MHDSQGSSGASSRNRRVPVRAFSADARGTRHTREGRVADAQ